MTMEMRCCVVYTYNYVIMIELRRLPETSTTFSVIYDILCSSSFRQVGAELSAH